MWMAIRNTFIIFILSGFWHGANWTFIAWGFLNALYIMPSIVLKTNRTNLEIVARGKWLPNLKDFLSIIVTFALTVFAWIFFRAESLSQAFQYIGDIFKDPRSFIQIHSYLKYHAILTLISFFMIIEWMGREEEYAIQRLGLNWHRSVRWTVYCLIVLCIFFFTGKEQQFIYFQF
jgi:D-alanyl-lipoteichoic acid acyltransferase DltB (MBOAT superfamily)